MTKEDFKEAHEELEFGRAKNNVKSNKRTSRRCRI